MGDASFVYVKENTISEYARGHKLALKISPFYPVGRPQDGRGHPYHGLVLPKSSKQESFVLQDLAVHQVCEAELLSLFWEGHLSTMHPKFTLNGLTVSVSNCGTLAIKDRKDEEGVKNVRVFLCPSNGVLNTHMHSVLVRKD